MPGSCWNAPTNRIAYASEVKGPDSPFLVDPSGANRKLVIQRRGRIGIEPTISPDGQWIAFQDGVFDAEGLNSIYKVRVDGSGLERLTSGNNDTQPNWSPRGDKIVFQRQPGTRLDEERPWDVFTMDVDGGNVFNVTPDADDEAKRTCHGRPAALRRVLERRPWHPGGRPLRDRRERLPADQDHAHARVVRRCSVVVAERSRDRVRVPPRRSRRVPTERGSTS